MKNYVVRPAALAAALSLASCATPTLPPSQSAAAPSTAAGPTAGLIVAPSNLSYGTVTSHVVKGKTTPADLLQAFGGPNISTLDSNGIETWVYERTATQSDVQTNSQSAQAAASLGAFFKFVDVKAGGSVERGVSSSSFSSSIRSLTVIVKFGPGRTVVDYTVRASNF